MTGRSVLRVPTPHGALSARWDLPAGEPRAAMALAHGAGVHRDHPAMNALAAVLAAHGIAVLRFNFPYTEAGRKLPDAQDVLVEVWSAVWEWFRAQPESATRPRLAAGRSMGGRMASIAASRVAGFDPDGLVFFAYPLHPAGKPDRLRVDHLRAVAAPMLFLSGTRDPLAEADVLKAAVVELGSAARLVWLEGADHGFEVLKRSGRTAAEVLEEVAGAVERWLGEVVLRPRSGPRGSGPSSRV
jgi:predicted alpha/beta-hydrolase family hydrolase